MDIRRSTVVTAMTFLISLFVVSCSNDTSVTKETCDVDTPCEISIETVDHVDSLPDGQLSGRVITNDMFYLDSEGQTVVVVNLLDEGEPVRLYSDDEVSDMMPGTLLVYDSAISFVVQSNEIGEWHDTSIDPYPEYMYRADGIIKLNEQYRLIHSMIYYDDYGVVENPDDVDKWMLTTAKCIRDGNNNAVYRTDRRVVLKISDHCKFIVTDRDVNEMGIVSPQFVASYLKEKYTGEDGIMLCFVGFEIRRNEIVQMAFHMQESI